MNNKKLTQDNIDKALGELLEDELLNISVDDAGEFYYSLNENGKKVAETILGIDKTDPEVHNA
jgi:DNA-binding PadR family transcriptional regulator